MNITSQQQNKPDYALKLLKQGILLFWSCWFLIACLSNITDFLIAKNMIRLISFHSGNYFALANILSIYDTPAQLLNLLFTLDITAQGMSAILFLIAHYHFCKRNHYWLPINSAFVFSMCLWATFIILEEIFIAYTHEGTHIRLFIFELISLLAIHLLPHNLTREK